MIKESEFLISLQRLMYQRSNFIKPRAKLKRISKGIDKKLIEKNYNNPDREEAIRSAILEENVTFPKIEFRMTVNELDANAWDLKQKSIHSDPSKRITIWQELLDKYNLHSGSLTLLLKYNSLEVDEDHITLVLEPFNTIEHSTDLHWYKMMEDLRNYYPIKTWKHMKNLRKKLLDSGVSNYRLDECYTCLSKGEYKQLTEEFFNDDWNATVTSIKRFPKTLFDDLDTKDRDIRVRVKLFDDELVINGETLNIPFNGNIPSFIQVKNVIINSDKFLFETTPGIDLISETIEHINHVKPILEEFNNKYRTDNYYNVRPNFVDGNYQEEESDDE